MVWNKIYNFAWKLARQTKDDVTLMGSGFASVKAKRLYKFSVEEDEKRVTKQKKIKVLYPPYPGRCTLQISIVATLGSENFINKYKMPNNIDSCARYRIFWSVRCNIGQVSRIPVIITSHGIRHKTAELITHGRFEKVMLKIEYSLRPFYN